MALGRGLDSLIPKKSRPTYGDEKPSAALVGLSSNSILDVSPEEIHVNPHQPRKTFGTADLESLINSIKVHGIMQPLIVTKRVDGGYELIAGERRLRSSKVLNLPTVPVIVRDAKEQEKLELALIENIQRKNLNALEEAIAFQRLIDEFNLTQEEAAVRLGKNRSTIANTLRILTLPEEVKQAIMDEKISEGHARSIASLESISMQLQLLKKILDNSLSVRDTEKEVQSVKKFKTKAFDPAVIESEEKLRNRFGTTVTVKKQGTKGSITIPFANAEDFQSLLNKLMGHE